MKIYMKSNRTLLHDVGTKDKRNLLSLFRAVRGIYAGPGGKPW